MNTHLQVTQLRASTYQKITPVLKSAIIYTALAALSTLSLQFAYLNPNHWLLTAASFCVLNSVLLPKILHSGSEKMIRIGLLVSTIAWGVLALGGTAAFSYFFSELLLNCLKVGNISGALFQGFLLTGTLGFIVPALFAPCRIAKELLHYPKVWQEKIRDIQKQFRSLRPLPFDPHGMNLQFNLLEPGSIPDTLTTRTTSNTRIANITDITNHLYLFALKVLLPEIPLEQWNVSLREIEDALDILGTDNQGNIRLYHAQFIPYFKAHLQGLLKYVKKEDFGQALSSLLALESKWVPHIFLKDEFLEFFKGDVLNKSDDFVKRFLDETLHLAEYEKKYQKLVGELTSIEQTLKQHNLSDKDKKGLPQQYEVLKKEFEELKENMQSISLHAGYCKKLAVFLSDPAKFPFKQRDALSLVLQDLSLFNKIDRLNFLINASKDSFERMLGDLKKFINQLTQPTLHQSFEAINKRLMSLCKHSLYVQVQGLGWPDLEKKLTELIKDWKEDVEAFEKLYKEINDLPELQQQIGIFQELTATERQDLSTKFNALKTKYEELCQMTGWKNLSLQKEYELPKEVENHKLLIELNEIWQKYQSLQNLFDSRVRDIAQLTSNLQAPVELEPTLPDRLQWIYSRMSAFDNSQNDEEEAYTFLGYYFVTRDYDILYKKLGVNSVTDIEEGLKAIGLNTSKDVLKSGILDNLPQGQKDEIKQKIFDNLDLYIKDYKKPSTPSVVNPPQIQSPQPSEGLKTKVAHTVYRMVNAGLLLVPVFIYPYPAAIGFGVGACYYILKRFGFLGTQQKGTLSNDFFRGYPVSLRMSIIKFSQSNREEADKFFKADFFYRMRTISITLLYSFITKIPPASFIRGFQLSEELLT